MLPDHDKNALNSDTQQTTGSTPQSLYHTTNQASPLQKDFSELDLSKYRSTIEICAEFQLDVNLPNGHAGNAAVLFSTFFKFAKQQVCIYTGQLFEGVFDLYPAVVQSAIGFLRRNTKNLLRIAVAEKVDYNDFVKKPFIAEILKNLDVKNRLLVYDVSQDPTAEHFAVMDKSAFRYETSHAQQKAIANFGNPARAEKLYNDFESIVRNAEKKDFNASLTSS